VDSALNAAIQGSAAAVFQTAAEQNGCYALNASAIRWCIQNNYLHVVADSTLAWQALYRNTPALEARAPLCLLGEA